ncbi:hypothetical protein EC991_001378 [Linnemannia zychae]|nr:hypothetical protein EC991_001378 [Linnemannia zychae]
MRTLIFLVAVVLLFTQSVSAQYTSPAPGVLWLWNYIADKALFVRQGSQFYSLDLTPLLSGNGNQAWKTLSTLNGPVPELDGVYQPIGVTSDGQSVVSFDPAGTVSSYSIGSDAWSAPVAMPVGSYTYENRYTTPVTDPRTGVVYIQVNYNNVTQMLAYDPSTNTRSFIPMPLTFTTPNYEYYMTWSFYMDGLVFFDADSLSTEVKFQIYRPTTNTWNYLAPTRDMLRAEMAYGGRKIIIAGGQSGFDTIPGVFVIDAATLTWSEGPPVANGRGGMACATAGDYLVMYGGAENFQNTKAPVGTIFYNLKTNTWGDPIPNPVTTAPPGATSMPPSGPRTSSGSGGIGAGSTDIPAVPPPPSTNNAGAIGGGVAGGVVVIGIIGFVFIRRRKQQNQQATSTDVDMPDSMGGINGGKIEVESAQGSSPSRTATPYIRSEHKEGAEQHYQQQYPASPEFQTNYDIQGNAFIQPQLQQQFQGSQNNPSGAAYHSNSPSWSPASPVIPVRPQQTGYPSQNSSQLQRHSMYDQQPKEQQPSNPQLRGSERASFQWQQDAPRSGAPQDRT